jgi:hypothetical protein
MLLGGIHTEVFVGEPTVEDGAVRVKMRSIMEGVYFIAQWHGPSLLQATVYVMNLICTISVPFIPPNV